MTPSGQDVHVSQTWSRRAVPHAYGSARAGGFALGALRICTYISFWGGSDASL